MPCITGFRLADEYVNTLRQELRNFMRRTLKQSAAILLPLLGLASVTGCTTRKFTVAQATHDQVLLFGNGDEPEDLDPQTVTGVPESHLCLALFEGLVTYDPKDLHPIPGVAES